MKITRKSKETALLFLGALSVMVHPAGLRAQSIEPALDGIELAEKTLSIIVQKNAQLESELKKLRLKLGLPLGTIPAEPSLWEKTASIYQLVESAQAEFAGKAEKNELTAIRNSIAGAESYAEDINSLLMNAAYRSSINEVFNTLREQVDNMEPRLKKAQEKALDVYFKVSNWYTGFSTSVDIERP